VKARILAIDDSHAALAILRKQLGDMAELTCVNDSEEGLGMALRDSFDCVVCDLEMPRMNGIEFVVALRQHRSRLQLPVLLLTAHTDVAHIVKAFGSGVSDYVTKPWHEAELRARVDTHTSLAAMVRRLEEQSMTDALTGLGNRRWFDERMRIESDRAERAGEALSLLLVDVDHFKRINDTYGHPAGDAVLREMSALLLAALRKYDCPARVGGEEFAVILPRTGADKALGVAQRLRLAIAARPLASLPIATTVSIGCAGGTGRFDGLYADADQRLYAAKRGGRDRVVGA
jgi:diguanylate cyclase (GGDEF)-like protein